MARDAFDRPPAGMTRKGQPRGWATVPPGAKRRKLKTLEAENKALQAQLDELRGMVEEMAGAKSKKRKK